MLMVGCGERSTQSFTVRELTSPARVGSAEPHLAQGPDGRLILSWQERGRDEVALRYSVLGNNEWQPAKTITRGDDWFVNWADFPSVTPISPDLWAAHWLVKRPGGTYAYDVAIALSLDSGQTWGKPITPHTDGTATEHGFVTLFPWQGGVGALWLDGRNMAEDGLDVAHGGSQSGGMTLRSVIIDHGPTQPTLIDDLVCDCCQTDVALGPDGPIAVYRNRTTDEIRDIYITRAVDNQWQPAKPVANDGWEIAGCPVNGPAIAVDGSDVAVAWFTGANDVPRVRLATSSDKGIAFSAPIDIDVGLPVGRVDVESLGGGDVAVSWLRTGADQQGELCVSIISKTGDIGPEQVVAKTSTARLSGFPQMMRSGDDLVFAWTDTSGEATTIQTALVHIERLASLSGGRL